MASGRFNQKKFDALVDAEEWAALRALLEAERTRRPQDHWVLTQLGVTYYEQKDYENALELFLSAHRLVEDCPLTLWHLAGTLDALGQAEPAIAIYTWLLRSKTTPEDDPCWESREWSDALKADCIYRLGVCFRKLGRKEIATNCFEQYARLLLAGLGGIYTIADVAEQLKLVRPRQAAGQQFRQAIRSTLQQPGIKPAGRGQPAKSLRFTEEELRPRRRVARKR